MQNVFESNPEQISCWPRRSHEYWTAHFQNSKWSTKYKPYLSSKAEIKLKTKVSFRFWFVYSFLFLSRQILFSNEILTIVLFSTRFSHFCFLTCKELENVLRACVSETAKDENQEREKITHCVARGSLIKTCILCFRCIKICFKLMKEERNEMLNEE